MRHSSNTSDLSYRVLSVAACLTLSVVVKPLYSDNGGLLAAPPAASAEFELSYTNGASAQISIKTDNAQYNRIVLTSFAMSVSGVPDRADSGLVEFLTGQPAGRTTGFVYSNLAPVPPIEEHWFGILLPKGQDTGVIHIKFPKLLQMSAGTPLENGQDLFFKPHQDPPEKSFVSFDNASFIQFAPIREVIFKNDGRTLLEHLDGAKPRLTNSKPGEGEVRRWLPSSGSEISTKIRLTHKSPYDIYIAITGTFFATFATAFGVFLGVIRLIPERHTGKAIIAQYVIISIVAVFLVFSATARYIDIYHIVGILGIISVWSIPMPVFRRLHARATQSQRAPDIAGA